MKNDTCKLFYRIVCALLVVMILWTLPVTAFAETQSIEMDNTSEDNLIEQDEVAFSSNTGYSYSAPDDGDFLIENVSGTISIADNIPIIQFGDYTVQIPAFDYYKVVDAGGNLRFYQADVLEDQNQLNNFIYIGIYIEEAPTYSIHVQYMGDESKMYNVIMSLNDEQFLYFAETSSEICLGTDDVSQRLKSSAKLHTRGTFENASNGENNNSENITNNSGATTLALNEIDANTYDSYTDSDGIINSYVSDYFWDFYLDDGETITDDPIVNIVPKELFFIYGEHIYVGKEYGFFVRVVVDTIDVDDYAVDVMVFDLIHTTPYFSSSVAGSEVGASKIVPLFQYKYRAAEAESVTAPLDPSLSRVVYPHIQYDYAEYFLKDIGFKVTLDNPTALNPGDSGYDPYEDNGAFMIQTRVNLSGVGLKKKEGDFLADTAMFTLGFVPKVGPALSVASYVHDLYNGFGNSNYFYTRSASVNNNEVYISTLKTNSTDQIAAYGNLIKSQSVEVTSNDEEPRLIHVGGYAEFKYVIARKSGSTYNNFRVITSISVEVVEDNTSLILFIPSGELVSYGRATGTYETGHYKRLNDVNANGGVAVTIPANSQTNIIKLIPKVSGSYKLATYSSQGDPNFRIYNATKGTTVVLADDDIDGANNRNAAVTMELIGGDIYYIEAFRYGTPYQYTLRIGYSPVATQTLIAATPRSVTTVKDSYQMFKFTPTTSGTYQFSTDLTSGDPQIFLFYANGVLLMSDDDDGDGLNALMDYYMTAGITYYIAVQGYAGNAASFSLTVTKK